MGYEKTDRIRRAAILVASLDEPLAERLLADLPPTEAARVLAEEPVVLVEPDLVTRSPATKLAAAATITNRFSKSRRRRRVG
jgi:hypothetical protein